jgi:hypothetical protein
MGIRGHPDATFCPKTPKTILRLRNGHVKRIAKSTGKKFNLSCIKTHRTQLNELGASRRMTRLRHATSSFPTSFGANRCPLFQDSCS